LTTGFAFNNRARASHVEPYQQTLSHSRDRMVGHIACSLFPAFTRRTLQQIWVRKCQIWYGRAQKYFACARQVSSPIHWCNSGQGTHAIEVVIALASTAREIVWMWFCRCRLAAQSFSSSRLCNRLGSVWRDCKPLVFGLASDMISDVTVTLLED